MRVVHSLAAMAIIAISCTLSAQPVVAPRPLAPTVIKPPVLVKPAPLPAPMLLAPLAINYVYTAVPQTAPPRRLGAVSAGSDWTCDQSGCKMSSPAAQPAVGGCNALARQIGPIGSYGRTGAMLTPAQLDECNRGIAGAIMLAATDSAPASPPSEPASSPVEPAPAPAPAPAMPAAVPSGITIVVSELAIAGGEQGTIDPTPGNLTITSGELSISGGALGERPVVPPPMTINVPEMSIIGG